MQRSAAGSCRRTATVSSITALAANELGKRATNPAVEDRTPLTQRPLEQAERAAAPREAVEAVGRPGRIERNVEVRGVGAELAHVRGRVRRVADTEQENEAAGCGEPVERAVDGGRADAFVPLEQLGGAVADRCDGIGRMRRAQRVRPAAKDLRERARAARRVGSERLVVVGEGRHRDESPWADRVEQLVDQLVRCKTDGAERRVDDDAIALAEANHGPSRRASVPPRIASRTLSS